MEAPTSSSTPLSRNVKTQKVKKIVGILLVKQVSRGRPVRECGCLSAYRDLQPVRAARPEGYDRSMPTPSSRTHPLRA